MCEEKKVYICADDNDSMAVGNTLKDAYENYINDVSEERPENLVFYEAVKVVVEVQFVKKEVVKKITAAKKVN